MAELVGRVGERNVLAELVTDIRQGQSRSLVLHGEAGIGKTARLTQLVDAAPYVEFVRVTGVEAGQWPPSAPAHSNGTFR